MSETQRNERDESGAYRVEGSTRRTSSIQSLFCPNIAIMQGYAPGEQPQEPGFIKLNTNENPYPPSPKVIEAIQAELADNGAKLRLYPDPMANVLRRAAAERFDMPLENILAGNGSDDLLTIIARCFAGPKPRGSILTAYPTYSLYKTLAEIEHSAFQTVDYPDNYTLPDGFALLKSRIVFLANPNSPTGTVIPLKDIRELAEKVSGILVIDEAYVDFAMTDCLALARELTNVIILRTFSKSYSLAGMRIGLAFAHPAIIDGMIKVKDSYNLDRLAIVAGVAALKDAAHMLDNRAKIIKTRDRLATELQNRKWTVLPSGANFVFGAPPAIAGTSEDSPPAARLIYEALYKRKILVRYFDARRLNDKLRITVGTDAEVDALLAAIDAIRNELSATAPVPDKPAAPPVTEAPKS